MWTRKESLYSLMAYKRNSYSDNHESQGDYSVPYIDAKPGTSEVPLDELDNFIVPGRDEHGAHQPITVNCPPLLVHQVDIIVRSQLFPYINREAFVRHAMVRQCRWLQGIRPEQLQQHLSPAIEAILERCFQSQMRKKVAAAFEGLRETILQCENDGEWLEVLRLCYYVRDRLKAVDPASVWQKRAWNKFIHEFGHYMNQAGYVAQRASMIAAVETNDGDSKAIREAKKAMAGIGVEEVTVTTPATGVKRLSRVMNEYDDGETVN